MFRKSVLRSGLSRYGGQSWVQSTLAPTTTMSSSSVRNVSSDQMRAKWMKDYTWRLSQGDKEWQVDKNMESYELSKIVQNDGSALKLPTDRCLLVVPKDGDGDGETDQLNAYTLPLLKPTMGQPCIDIRQLHGKTKLTTYDPGFMSTSSCHSSITDIDGPGGRLSHRGYHIEELCDKTNFVNLVFLLLYGDFPESYDEYVDHEAQITLHTLVHEKIIQFYKGFNHDAHPMAIMCAVVGALSSFYHDALDLSNPDHRLLCAYRLIGKMPTLAAMAYKTTIGQPIMYPRNDLSYAGNFLHMMFAVPTEEYKVNPVCEAAIDKFLMLHADHEQNASTSTVRIAGSSHANPYACIASGITALWGPSHGGANEAVLRMLNEIGTVDRIPEFVARAKDKKDPFRLMGFGHRVYKNYDPRATVLRKACHDLLNELGIKDEPLLKLAMELEKVAMNDDYFVQRNLFPNVDFYSGIVLKALGIPVNMYPVMFALGRSIGWISHWKEMIEDPKQRIGRPRQLYVGEKTRSVPDLSYLNDPKKGA